MGMTLHWCELNAVTYTFVTHTKSDWVILSEHNPGEWQRDMLELAAGSMHVVGNSLVLSF